MKKTLSLVLSFAMLICCCLCIGTANVAIGSAESRYGIDVPVPYGGIIQGYATDTVYYSRKDVSESYENPLNLPLYIASNIENACCITAGGAIIGHFDRYYEELIPDHTVRVFLGIPTYGSQDAAVNAMHQELYKLMGSTSAGTSVEGYKKGMTSYVQNKGRSIEISSIYSNSSLNKSAYMSALQSGKLLTVFLDGFSVVSGVEIESFDGYDTISNTIVNGLHAVAAYGYRNIKYYDASDKLVQEDNYLLVHTGFASAGLSMIRLNKYTTVDDGYVINIT